MSIPICIEEQQADHFPETRWSLIANSLADNEAARDRAISELCDAYWYPVYCFVRRKGLDPADAEDSTQSFFYELLSKERFRHFRGVKGKLRAYLLTSIKHHLRDEWVASSAGKRGGGIKPLSLDVEEAENRYAREPENIDSPEKIYEIRWALTILERAMKSLFEVYEKQGKLRLFQNLQPHISGDSSASFREIGHTLGLTEGATRASLFRMRKLYRRFLEREIRDTIAPEESVEDEIHYLNQVFSA